MQINPHPRKVHTTAKSAPSWRDIPPIHPAAELFPLVSRAELKELANDIKQHGLRQPLVRDSRHSHHRRTDGSAPQDQTDQRPVRDGNRPAQGEAGTSRNANAAARRRRPRHFCVSLEGRAMTAATRELFFDEIGGMVFIIARVVDWLEGVDGSMTKAEVIDMLNFIADLLAYRLHE
jgi:hypothetical protein